MSRMVCSRADIDLTPTEEMASNAARGLELREKHGRGGTAVGVARARDIKNRKNLSPDTVRRMHSFFSRHAGNEAGGEDDAGYISFLLWGGAAGRSWAKRKSAQLDKDENAMSDTRKEIMERLGSAGKVKSGRAEQVMRDGTVHLDFVEAAKWIPTLTEQELRGIVADARAAANAQPQGKKWNYYHDLVLTASDELQKRKRKSSRPGAKAKFAEDAREVAQEILRQLGGGRFMAMVGGKNAFHGTFGGKAGLQFDIGKGADGGVNRVIVKLDRGTDTYDMEFWRIGNRGMNVKKVSEASGVYADDLQRIFTSRTKFYTSLSRTGAKAKFEQAAWMPNIQQFLRNLTAEKQKIRVWIAGPTTVKVAGAWQDFRGPFGLGAAIANRTAYWLQQAAKQAGSTASMEGEDRKNEPRKGVNTTIWTVKDIPADAVAYLKAWGIGTTPGTFAGFTGQSAVAYARPGAKAKMAYAPSESDMKKWMKGWTLRLPMVPDAGIRHFNSFEEAKRYGDAKCGGFSCEISYDGRRVASKGALSPEGSWTKHSRPGAKAKMGLLTSISTLPNTGSVNMTAKRFLERLYRVNLKDYEGFENFHRELSEVIAGVVRDTNRSMKDGDQYGDWSGKDLAAIIQRKIGRSPALTRTAEAWLGVSMMSHPGAKAKMSKATDALDYIKSSIANGKTVYVQAGSRTTKITPQTYAKWEASGRPLFKMSSDGALLMASGSAYVRLTLADEMLARVSAMSRPGAKVRNAIREGEKVSASDDAVSRKIRKLMDEGKPQKQAVAIALDLERRGEL
jgi:hypothetical protein